MSFRHNRAYLEASIEQRIEMEYEYADQMLDHVEMSKTYRLIVEFDTKEHMQAFAEQNAGEAFKTDALDEVGLDKRTFILKAAGSRPESYKIK